MRECKHHNILLKLNWNKKNPAWLELKERQVMNEELYPKKENTMCLYLTYLLLLFLFCGLNLKARFFICVPFYHNLHIFLRKKIRLTHIPLQYLKWGLKFTVYGLFVNIVWPRDLFPLWGLMWDRSDTNCQHSAYLTFLVCCWLISNVKIRCVKSLKYVTQSWIQFCVPSPKI